MQVAHSERAHALLSASGAERWMNCTPSARMEDTYPEVTSIYAEEGTTAHEYAELLIKQLTDAERPETLNPQIEKIRSSRWYNEDFEVATRSYVNYVLSLMQYAKDSDPEAVILTEKRLDFSRYVPDGFGTGDFNAIAARRAIVCDLKFGKGVKKYAENNPQLKLYALGLYEEYKHKQIVSFTLVIFQPRLEHFDTWEISTEDLLKWAHDELMPKAQLATRGEGELYIGDWCKFCKAKRDCNALVTEFKVLSDVPSNVASVSSMEHIEHVLRVGEAVESYINAIRKIALENALNGNTPNGYKVVSGRASRKFTDLNAVSERLNLAGIPEDAIYVKKLKPLTELEKVLGKEIFDVGLSDLVHKPKPAPTLVPISDKRPAITNLMEFDDLGDTDDESGFSDLDA